MDRFIGNINILSPFITRTCQLQTEQKIVNADSLKSKTLIELAIEFWKRKDLNSIIKLILPKCIFLKLKNLIIK